MVEWLFIGGPVVVCAAAAMLGIWPRAAAVAVAVGAAVEVGRAIGRPAWSAEYGALVLALTALALWMSPVYFAGAHRHHPWPIARERGYYAWLGVFAGALMALGAPWPLVDLWVAVEATTLSSVLLVAIAPGPGALEASWKYLTLAMLGGLVALSGILMLGGGSPALVSVGAALILVGFGTKAGLVPFHTWLPDAHSEAPAPVSGLLSGAELGGILIVAWRGLTAADAVLQSRWPLMALLGLGVASLAIGVALISRQQNLKRLLAYSSVEHMGVVAVGLAFGGPALLGALLHVFTHGFAKSQAFYLSGSVQAQYGTVDTREIAGLGRHLPWTAGGLTIALAALMGLPPLGPFWSEWLVIEGGLVGGFGVWPIVVAVLLAAGFAAIGYRLPRLWQGGGALASGAGEPRGLALPVLVMSGLTASAGLVVPWLFLGLARGV
jgi:hydrogenase-4 component F